MKIPDKYCRVVLEGTILPGAKREQVIRELCELFHARESFIERVLSGNEVALKKKYTCQEAEKICQAIDAAGAGCHLIVLEDLEGSTPADEVGNAEMEADGLEVPDPQEARFEQEDDSAVSSPWEVIEDAADQTTKSRPSFTRKELFGFLGPRAEYYALRFSRMGTIQEPKILLGWHWPAFFAFFFWAVYRKMWFWAGLNLVGAYLLYMLADGYPLLMPILILYSLAWPVLANSLYFRHFCHYVHESRSYSTTEDRLAYLSRQGGVSKPALWIALLGSFGLSLLTSKIMVNDLVSQYQEQYGLKPGEETFHEQIRGDGTLLEDVGALDSPLARTSKVLSTMATGLKVITAARGAERFGETLDQLIIQLGERGIRDAWGNIILVERELHQVVILSPGPDGTPRTNDDVIHRIDY